MDMARYAQEMVREGTDDVRLQAWAMLAQGRFHQKQLGSGRDYYVVKDDADALRVFVTDGDGRVRPLNVGSVSIGSAAHDDVDLEFGTINPRARDQHNAMGYIRVHKPGERNVVTFTHSLMSAPWQVATKIEAQDADAVPARPKRKSKPKDERPIKLGTKRSRKIFERAIGGLSFSDYHQYVGQPMDLEYITAPVSEERSLEGWYRRIGLKSMSPDGAGKYRLSYGGDWVEIWSDAEQEVDPETRARFAGEAQAAEPQIPAPETVVQGELFAGNGGVIAARALAAGGTFRAPHYTANPAAMASEVTLAKGGVLLLDEIEQMRAVSLTAIRHALTELGDSAPYVFATISDPSAVGRLPHWIQALPRTSAEDHQAAPAPSMGIRAVGDAMRQTTGYDSAWWLDPEITGPIDFGVSQGWLFRPSTTQVEWTEEGFALLGGREPPAPPPPPPAVTPPARPRARRKKEPSWLEQLAPEVAATFVPERGPSAAQAAQAELLSQAELFQADPDAVAAYQERLEGKRERLEERAEKQRAKAAGLLRKGDLREEYSGIPFGQPILVGHHSERRHRKALERAESALRKGYEASDYAGHLESRAERVGSGGVSADDPEAVLKLRSKLAGLEARRDLMKASNKAIQAAARRHKTSAKAVRDHALAATILGEAGLSEGAQANLLRTFQLQSYHGLGYPSYELTNTGAEIRRVQARLAELIREHQRGPAQDVEHEGFVVTEDHDLNRIQLVFDGKPGEQTRKLLKGSGFRWSPRNSAWQRQLNEAGRRAAERAAQGIIEHGGWLQNPGLPLGFEGFEGFDQGGVDADAEALDGVTRGAVLRVGRSKWTAVHDAHTYVVPLVYKHGTSGRNMYSLTMAGRGDGTGEVWQIGGSGQRISDAPAAVGLVRAVGHEALGNPLGPRPSDPRLIGFDPHLFEDTGEVEQYWLAPSSPLHPGPQRFSSEEQAMSYGRRTGREPQRHERPVMRRTAWQNPPRRGGLTDAEARTIRAVLESGGDVYLTQGRLSREPWSVQKATVKRLIERGLLEGHPGRWFYGPYRASERAERGDDYHHRVFATAAGVMALRAYDGLENPPRRIRDRKGLHGFLLPGWMTISDSPTRKVIANHDLGCAITTRLGSAYAHRPVILECSDGYVADFRFVPEAVAAAEARGQQRQNPHALENPERVTFGPQKQWEEGTSEGDIFLDGVNAGTITGHYDDFSAGMGREYRVIGYSAEVYDPRPDSEAIYNLEEDVAGVRTGVRGRGLRRPAEGESRKALSRLRKRVRDLLDPQFHRLPKTVHGPRQLRPRKNPMDGYDSATIYSQNPWGA